MNNSLAKEMWNWVKKRREIARKNGNEKWLDREQEEYWAGEWILADDFIDEFKPKLENEEKVENPK